MESFEFITQGVADIFVNDNQYIKNNPEFMLYKLIKHLDDIKRTVFE